MSPEYLDKLSVLLGAELEDLRYHAERGSKPALECHSFYLRGMARMLRWEESTRAKGMADELDNAVHFAWERYKQVVKP